MLRIITIISITLILTGCKPLMKMGKNARRAKTAAKVIKKTTSSSYSSTQQITYISDDKLKAMAKDANKKLDYYRIQCTHFKNAFKANINGDVYNKTVNEFEMAEQKFVNWFNSKNFYGLRGSKEFNTKYINWLNKFRSYFESYSNDVIQAANRRYTSLQ